jgi:hypothetical protein
LALDRLTTARFRFVFTQQSKTMAETLATKLEGIRDDVARQLGVDWPGITEVRVGFDRQEFEALALAGQPPPWAVALAYPGQNTMLLDAQALVREGGEDTVRHEMVHIALGQLGGDWPRWFHEGYAQDVTQERRFRSEPFGSLARAVAADRVFHLRELETEFPSSGTDAQVAYALSAAFIEFARARHGPHTWPAVIDLVRAGRPFAQAYGLVTRTSVGADDIDFRQELPRRYPWWALAHDGTPLWGAAGVLMVVAWGRRRSEVKRLRARLAFIERQEDAAVWAATKTPTAANDDGASDVWAWRQLPLGPWRISMERPEAPVKTQAS